MKEHILNRIDLKIIESLEHNSMTVGELGIILFGNAHDVLREDSLNARRAHKILKRYLMPAGYVYSREYKTQAFTRTLWHLTAKGHIAAAEMLVAELHAKY